MATGFDMAEFAVPFPVHAEPHPRADLAKLGAAPLLVEDAAWPAWIARKRARLLDGSGLLINQGVSQALLLEWAQAITQAFCFYVPNGPIDSSGVFPWLGRPEIRDPSAFFAALTLSLQEDYVVMAPQDDGSLSVRVVSVCFPSGWQPAEKVGKTMLEIHEPVADNAALQRATPTMSAAMLSKGPFIRHVWTLAGNGDLARLPGEDTLAKTTRVDELWFRCERQITVPLAGRASLFLIRVFSVPYRSVVNTPERQRQMVSALAAMSPATIAYKNISRAVELILKSSHV